jgi:16S rRNA processing protein RimM
LIKQEEVYKIGRLGKAHGIKGEVTMQVDDDIFDLTEAEYLVLELDNIMVPFFIEEYFFKSDTQAIIKFEGIDTQERARELANTDVFFPISIMEEYNRNAGGEERALSYPMLVGYMVNDIGRVAYIDNQTENIMFELEDGTLIPASEELIEDIDIENKQIKMTIPEGLLDI